MDVFAVLPTGFGKSLIYITRFVALDNPPLEIENELRSSRLIRICESVW